LHLVHKIPGSRSLLTTLLALIGPLAACEKPLPEPLPEDVPAAAAFIESTCGNEGQLTASLAGALNVALDWSDGDLRCESMPRPDSEGIRLRFSGEISGERLAIIIALPTFEAGATGEAFVSNVTLTVEDSGRFFSTPHLDACWTDITANELLPDQDDEYRVMGSLSCVTPLGEINGDASVDIFNMRFTGVANWNSQ